MDNQIFKNRIIRKNEYSNFKKFKMKRIKFLMCVEELILKFFKINIYIYVHHKKFTKYQ